MSSRSPVPRPALGALASLLLLTACGGEQPEQTGTAGAPAASGSVSPAPSTAVPAETAAGGDTGDDTENTAGTADERATAEPADDTAPADEPTESPGAQEPAGDTADDGTTSGEPSEKSPPSGDSPAGGAAAGGASRAGWCATSALDVSAAPAGGAAGSVYVDVTVTNAAEEPCVLGGYPGVSFVDSAGTAVGVPAVRDAGVPGTGQVLAPGESATAALRMSRPGNHAACEAREATGLRVYPPENTEPVVVPFPAEACTGPGIQQLEIQGFGA